MPQSYTSLQYHIVFSTKDRLPLITPDYRQRLYDYIGGIIRAEKGILLAANGTADHTHLAAAFHQDYAVSQMLRIIKSRSSGWIHDTFPELQHFAWQAGYGAFSLSQISHAYGHIWLSRKIITGQ
ncbi:MAG: IS200/IS605 family transposase [Armatimonadota bacterium]